MIANQSAARLVSEPDEAYEWNLGICATGAGAVALDVWKRMAQHIEMGRFGLPEGGYPMCKVRLAERPLAERDADADDPVEKAIVIGRIAAPADFDLRDLLRQLDAAIAKREPCRLYVPDLCEAAGLPDRAAVERRRFEMIARD